MTVFFMNDHFEIHFSHFGCVYVCGYYFFYVRQNRINRLMAPVRCNAVPTGHRMQCACFCLLCSLVCCFFLFGTHKIKPIKSTAKEYPSTAVHKLVTVYVCVFYVCQNK